MTTAPNALEIARTVDLIAKWVQGDGTDDMRVALADGIREPCIYANKDEIRLIDKHAPHRIDLIRRLEREAVELRRERNLEQPGRYAYPEDATFFQTRNGQRRVICRVEHEHQYDAATDTWGPACEPVRALVNHTPMNIDQIVEWARTDHGGKQTMLFEPAPSGGCMRWGMCETALERDVGSIARDAPERDVGSIARDAATVGRVDEAAEINLDLLNTIIAKRKESEP